MVLDPQKRDTVCVVVQYVFTSQLAELAIVAYKYDDDFENVMVRHR